MKVYEQIAKYVAQTERNSPQKLGDLLRKFDHTLRIGNNSSLDILLFSFSSEYYHDTMNQGLRKYDVVVVPSFIGGISVRAKHSLFENAQSQDEAVNKFIEWLNSEV